MPRQHRTLLLILSFLFCLILISACGSKEEPASEQQQPDNVTISPEITPESTPETTEEPVTEQESPSEQPKETETPAGNQNQTSTPAAASAATDKPKAESSSSGHSSGHSSGKREGPQKVDQAPEKTASPQPTAKTASPPADTPSPEPASQVHVVEIVNFAFSPGKLTIKAGDRVTFINKDEVGHSATADDESFDTGMLDQDKSKEVTFSEDGEFPYYCLPHPGMKGTIVVEAK